ncbi:hypothetical protein MNBD_DELTA01-1977 [hydrothermal vent metagenome]|uniref:Glycosyltransferase n=1 Tax=hydrothermal vent metagenome TaxID=652676 RepID=A0A3B0R0K9_9ZZZZ
MKIAEIVPAFPPQHGGMGYVCLHNALELKRRGHDVTIFTLKKNGFDYGNEAGEVMGMKVVRLKAAIGLGDGGMIPRLCSRLKGFDVVHLHYPFYGGAEYVYLASLKGPKYMITYHMDVYGDTLLKKPIIATYEKAFMKTILRGATLIGALTTAHLKSSKAAKLIDWDKVIEMPNGVDIKVFTPAKKNAALIERYGLTNKTVALFVGNLQPFKRLDLLINAIEEIGDDRLALLVIGGGYNEDEYKKLVKDKGLEKQIIFAGAHSPEEGLPAHYNLGDFIVLPSTHSESFGLVVLEAMASGKPAIVTDLPGPASLVEEASDGFIVKAGDLQDLKEKILLLHKDPALRAQMGEVARKKVVAKYDWFKIGARLEEALLNII